MTTNEDQFAIGGCLIPVVLKAVAAMIANRVDPLLVRYIFDYTREELRVVELGQGTALNKVLVAIPY